LSDPPLLASGRDADVFDLTDGTVLRRYRSRTVPSGEVEIMRYAPINGYPVPEVLRVEGRDMVYKQITGARGLARRDEWWQDGDINTTRVDVWLWAVRLYRSRSASTAGCRGGHVRVNRVPAKAATAVKVGDRIEAFVERERVLEVVKLIDKRVGAPVAATCFIDHSPPAPVVKREPPIFLRERGAGRPTKRERRELDQLRRS
jgi:ribosome-associated heat shock protein Hsp15